MSEYLEGVLGQFQNLATWEHAGIGVVAGLILRLCWKFVRRGLWLVGAPVRLLWRASRPLPDGMSPDGVKRDERRLGLPWSDKPLKLSKKQREELKEWESEQGKRLMEGSWTWDSSGDLYCFDSQGIAWKSTTVPAILTAPSEKHWTAKEPETGDLLETARMDLHVPLEGKHVNAPMCCGQRMSGDKRGVFRCGACGLAVTPETLYGGMCRRCGAFSSDSHCERCATQAEIKRKHAGQRACQDCGQPIDLDMNRCHPCHRKFRAEDEERQRQAMRDLERVDREIVDSVTKYKTKILASASSYEAPDGTPLVPLSPLSHCPDCGKSVVLGTIRCAPCFETFWEASCAEREPPRCPKCGGETREVGVAGYRHCPSCISIFASEAGPAGAVEQK